ncbi:hypothetical protein [Brevibacillus brevis]|uniref:hypothetical protein n=1 Tax=Brevibacillus brevis TaxID=1393 RepID=UPI00165E8A2D|nr:hypothetical protein [Brevibacillus brevis]
MNLKVTIARINNIRWDRVGSNSSEIEADLACEFLRRLACFFKENSIKPMPPIIANIAKLIGDNEEEVTISDYCNVEAMGDSGKNIYVYKMFEYYLQLARFADKNQDAIKYLSVYEPLIKIFEREGMVVLKPGELNVVNCAHIPLNSWYDKFLDMKPLNMENL